MKNRGSALLITLIFIAILATILLSIGRSMVAQTSYTTATENSTIAYDLAEAGIEDALMRFRGNAQYELCSDGNQVKRYQLSGTGVIAGASCINPDSSQPSTSTPTYDLKVSSKVTQLGFVDSSNTYAVADNPGDSHDPDNGKVRIKEGETLEFDVTNVNTNMTIYWEPDDTSLPTTKYIQMKYQILCPDASGNFVERFSDLINGTRVVFNPSSYTCQTSGSERKLRIKAFIGVAENAGVLENRDEDAASAYAIRTAVGNIQFGTHVATITSTGYYGGAKRQLIAKVDKRNGALLGIFDYALFSGGGKVGTGS